MKPGKNYGTINHQEILCPVRKIYDINDGD
jgi:hypothetical protein